ncbi:MAG: DUF2007 domain-containing protein [Pseudomonadota bacterium]
MREVMRTNDVVALSFATALLRDSNIPHAVMDENMSILEGSIGVLPRRLLVEEDRVSHAVRLLEDADLGGFLNPGVKSV